MKTTIGLITFFVFSFFFLSNCFSIGQITRYYPKKLVVYPLAKYTEFKYFINITYKDIPAKYCNNTSSFKDYKPFIFGEVSSFYPLNTLPNISISNINITYFKNNKTCLVSIEYKYLPKTHLNKNTVYIGPFILNPYPDIFDPNIVNISKLTYRINGFVLCIPKIYKINSLKFAKYKIFFVFNISNFPVSLLVLNISKPFDTFEYNKFKQTFEGRVLRCYYVTTPYIKPKYRKLSTYTLQNLSYNLYSFETYGLYGFTFGKATSKTNIKKTNIKTNKNNGKNNFKKIYIVVLIILVIVILVLLYYYIRKERGEW